MYLDLAMADSDEEHERSRSRDKFRRERNDYGDKPRNRGDYRERRTWRDDHEVIVCTVFIRSELASVVILLLLCGTACLVCSMTRLPKQHYLHAECVLRG